MPVDSCVDGCAWDICDSSRQAVDVTRPPGTLPNGKRQKQQQKIWKEFASWKEIKTKRIDLLAQPVQVKWLKSSAVKVTAAI